MSHFFILGLPRSRTAWLANWFTYGRSFCLHDAGRFARSVEELASALGNVLEERPGLRYAGSSDSSNGMIFDDLARQFPDARFLLVERDLEHSIAWAREERMNTAAVKALHKEHQRIRGDGRVLTMPFEDFSAESMRAVQEWLTPGEPFDELRYLLLDGLNVAVNMSRYYDWCEVS